MKSLCYLYDGAVKWGSYIYENIIKRTEPYVVRPPGSYLMSTGSILLY